MNELRQALDTLEEWRGRTELLVQMTGDVYEVATWTEEVAAAARSWLTLQQADETTVEKVARFLYYRYRGTDLRGEQPEWGDDVLNVPGYLLEGDLVSGHDYWRIEARAVLAAIVGEET